MRVANISLMSATVLIWSSTSIAQNPPASVAVYAQHHGGDVVYHYQIRNNGPGEIVEFFLGCRCAGDVVPNVRLQLPPAGISALVPPAPGEALELPEDS